LGKEDKHHQAIATTIQTVSASPGGTLCGLELSSTVDTLHYDDFLIFTLNDYLLIASHGAMVDSLEREGNVYKWDFAKVRGQGDDFDQETEVYCLSQSEGSCTVPGHDEEGPFKFDLASADVAQIAAQLQGSSQLAFGLSVTGDNDDGDCSHTEFDLSLTLKYW
jgi:hypothetical protein